MTYFQHSQLTFLYDQLQPVKLFYKQYGEAGSPLVILHGLLGASGNWHTLSKNVFGKQFRTFAVDQRNHGRSPHSDHFDYEAMVEDLKTFISQHDLSPAHLLGHSMGGKTAMQFALTYPEMVRSLIVADMPPGATKHAHRELLEALRGLELSTLASRSEIDAALSKSIRSLPVRQFLLKNLNYDPEVQRYSWKMNLEAIYRNYSAVNKPVEGAPFDGPTCFIRGEKSGYVTDEAQPLIRRLFPQAQFTTIPGAGHWLHAGKPKAFGEAVMEFLGN